jgi:hypothetical protein
LIEREDQMGRLVLLAGITAIALVNVAHATTNPAVFKCEDKAAAAVNKWGAARGKCLSKCKLSSAKGTAGLSCSNPPGLDAVTAACTTKADTKYIGTVVKSCPAGTFPTCGGYAGDDPNSYAVAQIAAQSALVDPVTVPLLMCDDALLTCESKVVATLSKLSAGLGKCLSKCYAASQVKGDATKICTPQGGADPFGNLDTTTKTCVTTLIDKANLGIMKACPTAPTCGLLYAGGLASLQNIVVGSLAGNYASSSSNPYCTQ